MSLKSGTKLGPYEILSLLGSGGMGDVYKAHDTRLHRIVALKTLRAHLADNPEVKERFEREARTVASLQHERICVLYDIRKDNGIDYLVLEYLEGETLATRLLKGPLAQVLQFSIEISDALDKAHRKGVTHRDIKPGNIMLVKSGTGSSTKLLDFGLAKLKQAAPAEIPLGPDDPTPPLGVKLRPPTVVGTIMGTFQYMSPEQAEGNNDTIDARTDIFSFGAMIYEMVTGTKAFEGKSTASVIAKVLQYEPPAMSSLVPVTPPALDRVVKQCLAKEPDERWQTASDLCRELQWIKESGGQPVVQFPVVEVRPPVPAWLRMLPWSLTAFVVVVAIIATWLLKPSPPQPVTHTAITLPPSQHLAALDQPAIAISPDGKNLVYVAVQENQSPDRKGGVASAALQQLYLRPLDSMESKPIAGTEGAVGPFFSPDSQWIGFFAGEKLKKVSVNGGAAQILASAPSHGGASWSSQGTLAFQGTTGLGLQQVSKEGGTPQPLTRTGKGEQIHRWPEFLPDGKIVLFAFSATLVAWNNSQIAVQPLSGSERKVLAQGTDPRFAPTGHLLFAQSGTLIAAPFDSRRLSLTGGAVPALDGVMQSVGTGAAQYSTSSTGTLVYLTGGVNANRSRMVWVSRNGEEQYLPAASHNYQFPRVSPEGHRVAVNLADQDSQIWVYDLSRDTLTRLTFDGNDNNTPVWSPDGRRIVFRSDRAGPQNMFWQPADGSGGAERLTTIDSINSPNSFSPDGQLLAFMEISPETGRDIWVLKLADHKAQPFLRTRYEDSAPKFSPDGKWLAYSSDESGRREIYVQPYPGPGGKWQVSTDGGQEPVWNPKGGDLFYRNGSKMMVVDVTQSPDRKGGETVGFSAGKPRMLFEGPYLPTGGSFPNYDISPDGQRFLMLKPVESQTSATTQINVVLNWFEELKKKVPTGK